MKKISILQICNGYYQTKLYSLLFEKMRENNILNDIFVFSTKQSGYIDEKKEKNIFVSRCYSNIMRGLYFIKQRIVFKIFNEYYNIKNYDLLHAHTVFSNGDIAYRAYKKYKIPYIVAVRNTDINIFFKYFFFLRRHGVKILENASGIIFLSPLYKKKCVDKYIPNKKKGIILEKSFVIPNGIDDFWFQNQFKKKEKSKNEIRIIYVGSIDKNKNIETTIKACEFLIKKSQKVKLTVIGEIVKTNYSNLLKESFIDYVPHCPKEKLIEYYRENDIFVMPSKYETFGLVYAEALSQGLPIIYTRGQGFDGQIEEGKVGYSVQYNDYEELAKKIIIIYENYEHYTKNIENYLHKFKWNSIAQEYSVHYNNIIRCNHLEEGEGA